MNHQQLHPIAGAGSAHGLFVPARPLPVAPILTRFLAFAGLLLSLHVLAPRLHALTPDEPLLIDGAGQDVVLRTITSATDLYFIGVTSSPDLPVTTGATYAGDNSATVVGDVVVGRVSLATGQTVWLTTLGGSASDNGNGIDLSADGKLLIGGWTTSTDFPVTPGAQQSALAGASDAFLAELDPATGAVLYASYLGGTADDQFADLAYLPLADAWALVGFTTSTDIPITRASGSLSKSSTVGDVDGLIVVVPNNGTRTPDMLAYHRRFPGVSNQEIILGVCADPGGNFWITGTTTDTNFWDSGFTTPNQGGRQAFLNQIDRSTGARLFSKTVGGSGDDTPQDVARLASSGVVIVGTTTSTDYPGIPSTILQPGYGGGASDGFIHYFDVSSSVSDGYATYFGGAGADAVRAIVADPYRTSPYFHIAGVTGSTALPAPNTADPDYLAPGQPENAGGASDGFVALLRADSGTSAFTSRFFYSRFSYAGSPGEDGFTTLVVDPTQAPAEDSLAPGIPLAAGTSNQPATPAPAALPSGSGLLATPAPATTRQEAAYVVRFLGEVPSGADLVANTPALPIDFSTDIPFVFPFEIHFPFINAGPEQADEVALLAQVPAQFDIIRTRVEGVGAGASVTIAADSTHHLLSATVPVLPSGETTTLVATVSLVRAVASGRTLPPITGSIGSVTPDPRANNNLASAQRDTARLAADLAISAITADKPFVPGGKPPYYRVKLRDVITYDIVVTNLGPQDASFIRVALDPLRGVSALEVFDLPPGATAFRETTGPEGDTHTQLIVDIPALGFLESATFKVRQPVRREDFDNQLPLSNFLTASVISTVTQDPELENNVKTVFTRVPTDLLGDISLEVFNDLDGDGLRGADEAPLPGVEVRFLHQPGDVQIGASTTNADGRATSPLDNDGEVVKVVFDTPAGFARTVASNHPDQLARPADILATIVGFTTVSVGQHGLVELAADRSATAGRVRLENSGDGATVAAGLTVFADLDGDGVHDPDEPSAVTDANGFYRLPDLPPGDVAVRVVLPAGYTQRVPEPTPTNPAPPRSIEAPAGIQISNTNFTVRAVVDLGIVLRLPENNIPRDGRRRLEIDLSNHSALPVAHVIATLAAPLAERERFRLVSPSEDPRYDFLTGDTAFGTISVDTLLPGETITVSVDIETLAEGVVTLEGIVVAAPIDSVPANNRSSAPFLVSAPGGVLAGEMFDDRDGDGVRDPDEPLLPGQTIIVTDADGTSRTVASRPDGSFQVGGLANGPATLAAPAGSGAPITLIGSPTVTIQSSTPTHIPVGFITGGPDRGAITGLVFTDVNQDGARGFADTPRAGMRVYLLSSPDADPRSAAVAVADTRADGRYFFRDVAPGRWFLRLVPAADELQTQPFTHLATSPADLPSPREISHGGQTTVVGDFGVAAYRASAYSVAAAWSHFSPPAPDYSLKPAPAHLTALNSYYTYDGNRARLVVRASNSGFTDVTMRLSLVQSNGGLLPERFDRFSANVVVPERSTVDVPFDLDTDGLAWLGVNPAAPYRISVEARVLGTEFFQKFDTVLAIRPRPIVAAHGLWSSAGTWELYPGYLASVRDDWEFYAVGDGQYPGVMDTGQMPFGADVYVSANARTLGSYIDAMRNARGAVHFDLIGHSMGGLISRRYIHSYMLDAPFLPASRPLARHLVMMGTPNEGSGYADILFNVLFVAYGLERERFPINLFELKPDTLKDFNSEVTRSRRVEFSIAAGDAGIVSEASGVVIEDPNDGIVPVSSAFATKTPALAATFAHRSVVNDVLSFHTLLTKNFALFANFVRPILDGTGAPIGTPSPSPAPSPAFAPLATAGEVPLADDSRDLIAAGLVEIPAGQTRAIPLPIGEARALFAFVTDQPGLESMILDPEDSPLELLDFEPGNSGSFVRPYLINDPVAGTHHLTLVNTTEAPIAAAYAAHEVGGSLHLLPEAVPGPSSGSILLRARIEGSHTAPASVTARFAGLSAALAEITLLDDGAGPDATADDGTYTALVTSLVADRYQILVTADFGEERLRLASTSFSNLGGLAPTLDRLSPTRFRLSWPLAAGDFAFIEQADSSSAAEDEWAPPADADEPVATATAYVLELDLPSEASAAFRLRLGDAVSSAVATGELPALRSQTIKFAQPAPRVFGTAPKAIPATASSRLPVSIEVVSGPAILGADGLLALTGAGSVVLRATQPGNETFAAAETVERTLVVNPASQRIAFDLSPAKLTLGAPPPALAASADSGLPVTFAVDGPAEIVEGALVIRAPGPVRITASQAGDDDYRPAASVTRMLQVVAASGFTLGDLSRDYDGTARAVSVSGLPSGFADTLDIAYSGPNYPSSPIPPTDAGVYRVTARFGNVTRTATLRIDKAVLSVDSPGALRLVGQANPSDFDFSYSGFIPGEDEGAIATPPAGVVRASPSSPPGAYPVTLRGGVAANYTFAPGDLGPLVVVGFGGSYEALLLDADTSVPAGHLAITVPKNSLGYTGVLRLAREAAPVVVSSTFRAPGTAPLVSTGEYTEASARWARASSGSDALALDFTIGADGTLAGSLDRNGELFANLSDGRLLRPATPRTSVPWAGAHTLVLASPSLADESGDERDFPAGASVASAAISPSDASLTLAGTLADGAKLTGKLKAWVTFDSEDAPDRIGYLLWLAPQGRRTDSFLASSIELIPHPETGRFGAGRRFVPIEDGEAFWQKAASSSDKTYREGFGPLRLGLALDPWLPPASAAPLPVRLGLATAPSDTVSLVSAHGPSALGIDALGLPTGVQITPANAISVTAPADNPARWRVIKFNAATGSFNGSFVPDASSKSTAPFTGIFRQAPLDEFGAQPAAGFFLLPSTDGGTPRSGEFRFFAEE